MIDLSEEEVQEEEHFFLTDQEYLESVPDKNIEIYKLYREKVVHEDTLVNFRTSWFVTLQAFLFTSFALSMDKLNSEVEAMAPLLFSIVGFFACLTTLASVLAADRAINKTVKKWTEPYDDKQGAKLPKGVRDIIDPNRLLPAVKGGGSSGWIGFFGSISSKLLPIVVAFFWVVLFSVSLPEFQAQRDHDDAVLPSGATETE